MRRNRSGPIDAPSRTLPRVPKLPSLKRLRVENVWSIDDLHRESGVSRNTISRIEKGGEAHYATIRRLAEALKVDARQLMAPPS